MGENFYNTEDHNNISDLLKQLPKLDAPDNFEFNLMVKIENGNFSGSEEVSASKGISWVYAPAAVFVACAFILYFTVFTGGYPDENLLMMELAQPISNGFAAADTMELQEYFIPNENNAGLVAGSTVNQNSYRLVVNPNDVVEKEKMDYFTADYKKEVDLDNLLRGNTRAVNQNKRLRVVGEGNKYYYFNGFIIPDNEAVKDNTKAER